MAATPVSPRIKRIVINEDTPNRLALWECRSTDGTRGAGSGITPAHAFHNWMASKGYFRLDLPRPKPHKHEWQIERRATRFFCRWPFCKHCGEPALNWVD